MAALSISPSVPTRISEKKIWFRSRRPSFPAARYVAIGSSASLRDRPALGGCRQSVIRLREQVPQGLLFGFDTPRLALHDPLGDAALVVELEQVGLLVFESLAPSAVALGLDLGPRRD